MNHRPLNLEISQLDNDAYLVKDKTSGNQVAGEKLDDLLEELRILNSIDKNNSSKKINKYRNIINKNNNIILLIIVPIILLVLITAQFNIFSSKVSEITSDAPHVAVSSVTKLANMLTQITPKRREEIINALSSISESSQPYIKALNMNELFGIACLNEGAIQNIEVKQDVYN